MWTTAQRYFGRCWKSGINRFFFAQTNSMYDLKLLFLTYDDLPQSQDYVYLVQLWDVCQYVYIPADTYIPGCVLYILSVCLPSSRKPVKYASRPPWTHRVQGNDHAAASSECFNLNNNNNLPKYLVSLSHISALKLALKTYSAKPIDSTKYYPIRAYSFFILAMYDPSLHFHAWSNTRQSCPSEMNVFYTIPTISLI